MTAIAEYPAFNPKYHRYIVATAGGDGWEVTGPLLDAIKNDMAQSEVEDVATEDWVDSLAVWTIGNKSNDPTEIARWTREGWRPKVLTINQERVLADMYGRGWNLIADQTMRLWGSRAS